MQRKRYTENQIVQVLKEVENGLKVADVCRKNGIATATYHRWKSKYGGLEVSDLKRLKELEEENRRLKKMYADLAIENELIKEALEKKL